MPPKMKSKTAKAAPLTVKGMQELAPGRYRDKETRGLYLQVTPGGTKLVASIRAKWA